MGCYVFRDPRLEVVAPQFRTTHLYERKRPLLSMMSARGSLRVLCAPPLSGKSILAFQYANIMVSLRQTIWIDASDPRFLRDIDACKLLLAIAEAMKQGLPRCDLAVFDAVPLLSAKRLDYFSSFINALLLSGCEVVITTREASFADSIRSFENRVPILNLGVRDIAFTQAELKQSLSSEDLREILSLTGAPSFSDALAVPAVLCDVRRGRTRLLDALRAVLFSSVFDVAALTALIFEKGRIETLAQFVSGFECTSDSLERFATCTGISQGGGSFRTLSFTVEERFTLLQANKPSLVAHSPYASESDYLHALAQELLSVSESDLANLVLSSCTEQQRRELLWSYGDAKLSESTRSLGRIVEHPRSRNTDHPRSQSTERSYTQSVDHCRNQDVDHLRSNTKKSSRTWFACNELVARRRDPSLYMLGCGRELDKFATEVVINKEDRALSPEPIVINLFGKFEILRGGRRVPAEGEIRKKGKLLIGLLLVNYEKDVPRNWVEQVVWPDARNKNGHSSYYNLWSYVKAILAETEEERFRLSRLRDSISLRSLPITCDVHVFDKLVNEFSVKCEAGECKRILDQIEAIYQGPLLPGISNAQIDSYRRKYKNKVLDVMMEGVSFLVEKGESYSALQYASFAFQVDPTREDVCYVYMNTLKRLGQFTAAISSYLECHSALVERYGIEASRRLDTLYEEILNEVSSA